MGCNDERSSSLEAFKIEKSEAVPLLIHLVHAVDENMLAHYSGFNPGDKEYTPLLGVCSEFTVVGYGVVVGNRQDVVPVSGSGIDKLFGCVIELMSRIFLSMKVQVALETHG